MGFTGTLASSNNLGFTAFMASMWTLGFTGLMAFRQLVNLGLRQDRPALGLQLRHFVILELDQLLAVVATVCNLDERLTNLPAQRLERGIPRPLLFLLPRHRRIESSEPPDVSDRRCPLNIDMSK